MNLEIKNGDATAASRDKQRGVIIAHIVNCKGAWGKGFVLALNKMSPIPQAAYKAWKQQSAPNNIPLGDTLFVEVEPGKFVANMCAQKSINRKDGCLIDYEAFENCMLVTFLRALRLGYDVHMPEGIGSGLAGGDKDKIHGIIKSAAEKAEQDSKFVKMVRECLNKSLEVSVVLWRFEDKAASSYVSDNLGDAADDEGELKEDPDEIARL